MGEYSRAINYRQQSLAIAQQIGDCNGEANSWFNLGETLKIINENLDAKTAYENARQLYQIMGLNKYVKNCTIAIKELENHD